MQQQGHAAESAGGAGKTEGDKVRSRQLPLQASGIADRPVESAQPAKQQQQQQQPQQQQHQQSAKQHAPSQQQQHQSQKDVSGAGFQSQSKVRPPEVPHDERKGRGC